MNNHEIDFYRRLAKGLASQFGPQCEVVVHDLEAEDLEHTIVALENGYISDRQLGDGPSHVVLEGLQHRMDWQYDRLAYLTKTKSGKILKSSTIFIRDEKNTITGILGINYDITQLIEAKNQLDALMGIETETSHTEHVTTNIADLLDELIEQSVQSIGKPIHQMSKEDKVSVVRKLNDTGAFLITKSGPKVCEYLGISKYTLYSYLDEIKSENN